MSGFDPIVRSSNAGGGGYMPGIIYTHTLTWNIAKAMISSPKTAWK